MNMYPLDDRPTNGWIDAVAFLGVFLGVLLALVAINWIGG